MHSIPKTVRAELFIGINHIVEVKYNTSMIILTSFLKDFHC